ncbi:hypothetical protein [Streptomyces sp. NBC_01092]|uniref:hypothetical protein n=1 Tax=Streptomyces sp. NBC_01092 TaxID=2903748 RepID=UPI003870D0A7|nr:hypothetical protein OG254_40945 [Streptomyces sp. NBC_01092]
MRRTARALSVAALAGAVVGAPASAAFADPAAEVSPGSVSPGGSITVSVTCDALDGAAPATLEATSQAFEEGTVELKRVSGTDAKAAGAAYRGTARVPPAENFEGDPDAAGPESAWTVDGTCPAAGGGEGKEWSATFTVAGESGSGKGGKGSESGGGHQSGTSGGGESGWGGSGGQGGTEGGGRTCTEPPSDWTGAEKPEAGQRQPEWDGTEAEGTGAGGTGIGGTGTGADESESGADESGAGGTGTGGTGTGGIEPEWDTSDAGEPDPHANAAEPSQDESGLHSGKGESGAQDCAGAGDQQGVQAGTGGTFTDSVPALVAGGVLMAGAFGGAVYRLRRRRPTTQD